MVKWELFGRHLAGLPTLKLTRAAFEEAFEAAYAANPLPGLATIQQQCICEQVDKLAIVLAKNRPTTAPEERGVGSDGDGIAFAEGSVPDSDISVGASFRFGFAFGIFKLVRPDFQGWVTFKWGIACGPAVQVKPGFVQLTNMAVGGANTGADAHLYSVTSGYVEQRFSSGVRLCGVQENNAWVGPVVTMWPDDSCDVFIAANGGVSRHLMPSQAAAMVEAMRPTDATLPSKFTDWGMQRLVEQGNAPAATVAASSGAGFRHSGLTTPPAGLEAIHTPPSPAAAAPGAEDWAAATPGRSPPGAPPLDASAPAEARHGRAAAEVRRLLSSVTVEELGGGRSRRGRVAVVELSHSVEEAMALLTAHSVLSGPVLDRAAAGGRGRFVAVLHIADVFSAMVEMMHRRGAAASAASRTGEGSVVLPHPKHSPLAGGKAGRASGAPSVGPSPSEAGALGARHSFSRGSPDTHLRAAIAHKRRLMRMTVRDVLDMAARATAEDRARPAVGEGGGADAAAAAEDTPVVGSASVLASAMSDGNSTDDGSTTSTRGAHRTLSRATFRQLPAGCPAVYAAHVLAAGAHAVPIVDLDGGIVRVVTQADVVRFLAAHLDALPATMGLTLGDLGLDASGRAGLVVAKFSERVMDVFQRMRRSNSAAVPVVDASGSMTANLSMTDAKAVAKQASIGLLDLPVSSFLTEIATATDIKSPSIYCRPSDLLSSCISTLAATRIHQVYFVDDALRPTAVLRVSDVLRTLLGEEA